jgi:hypothetical protein
MPQIGPIKTVCDGATLATVVAILSAISSVAGAASDLTEMGRNPHNFVLKVEMHNWINGSWSGDAKFAVSACPRPACFHLAGPVKIVSSPKSEVADYEGFFPIVGLACVLHFEQLPYGGKDSGDYRLTLISKDQVGKGCASLPAGLKGVYSQGG